MLQLLLQSPLYTLSTSKAINSNNAVEIGKHIDDFMSAKREFEQQMEGNKMAMSQANLADKDKDRTQKMEEIKLKEGLQKDRELAVAKVDNNKTTK